MGIEQKATIIGHTKEPWALQYDDLLCLPEIINAEGIVVIPALRYAEKDMYRIIACVNACAGYTSEQLENDRCALIPRHLLDDLQSMKQQRDELQSSVNGLVDSNLYQAKLLQAQQAMLLGAGIECGSKEIIAGIKAIESLKQQRNELLDALDKLARLGNEPHFGNSAGNQIAREAIAKAVSNEK